MSTDRTNRLIRFDNFEIDLDAITLRFAGATVDVEPQVFDLIAFLAANRGRLVSYEEIVANVWKGRIISDAAIATRVNAARRALGDSGAAQRVIRTVRGRGLRFDLPAVDTCKPAQPDVRPASRYQKQPGQSVVGVFPFELISEDVTQTYLATGLADEITSELCRFRSLMVLARDSMLRVSRSSLGQLAELKDLGATHFVRGTLQVRVEVMRMSVQLVEAATERLVWSEQYDFCREQLFDVQDDVVSQVVSTLFGKLVDHRTTDIRARPTEIMSAYDCVLRGMAIHKSGHTTKTEAEDAVSWFDRALELDPNYARAHAWRACAAAHLWPAQPSEEHLRRNMRSVELALSIDPTDSEAHRIKGALHTFQREFEGAVYHLRRAKARRARPPRAHRAPPEDRRQIAARSRQQNLEAWQD